MVVAGGLFAALWAAAGCGPADNPDSTQPADKTRVTVVCTTTMIADLARQIAGDNAEVLGIMRPGEDPHIYEVRPRDAQTINRADLVLANGLHLEATLGEVIEHHKGKARVVYLAQDERITPLESQATKGAPDPHCWFNVQYFRVYAQRTTDALAQTDPAHAEAYRTRGRAYMDQLDALDTWVREQLATVPRDRRVMVTSHDAFHYFGKAYDIDVYAIIGISTEQQPRPRDVETLTALVKDRNVRALFIETSVSKTLNDLVRRIADQSGAKIGGTLYSDSLGDAGSPAPTYLDMLRHNTTTIVDALR